MDIPIGETHRDALKKMIVEHSFQYRDDPPFTLACGEQSHYYFNCKATLLIPEGFALAADVCRDIVLNEFGADGIGGLTLGADPLTYGIAHSAWKLGRIVHPLIVRKEPKDHGTQLPIEGHVSEVSRIVAVDDVITTGGSTIKAINAFRDAGLKVIGAVVLIDREEMNGKENIEELGVPVRAVFRRSEFRINGA